jgi:hypothetical protein
MPWFAVDHAAMEQTRAATSGLGVASGAALYVGAVLGPGVLLLLRATAALSLALVVVVLAFSGPYLAAPAGIALLALAFVSARADGAAWRGSSAAAGCRAGRSLEEAPASRNAG